MSRKSLFVILALMILSVQGLWATEEAAFTARLETSGPILELNPAPGEAVLLPAPRVLEGTRSPDDTISYDGANANNFGLTAGGSFYSAVRFTPLNVCTVKALTIFLAEQSWSCSVCVWDEGTATNPGARLQTWTATSTPDAWNRFDLPTPLVRPGAEEFWGGVWLTHLANEYPVGCDAGPAIPQRSYVSTDGVIWQELAPAGVDANINDRAIVEYSVSFHDVTPVSINSPGTGVWVDTTYGVQVTVANQGDFSETFDVECIIRDSLANAVYGDTQSVVNLGSGAQQPVNFANWTPSLYDERHGMRVTTLLAGDEVPANDTLLQVTRTYEQGEIAYDDFIAESFWVVSSPNGPTDAFVVQFTPYVTPPFYVTKWKIYVNDTTAFDNVRLFRDWNSPFEVFPAPAAPSAPGWIIGYFDTSLTRMDTADDIMLGAQFANGQSGPGIGMDENAPDLRSFWTQDLVNMNQVTDGDWLMRIVHTVAEMVHNGGVVSIDEPPDTVFAGYSYSPIATVRNFGGFTETFDVTCVLDGFNDTVLVTNLLPGAAFPCTFDVWGVPLGDSISYNMLVRTWVTDDSEPANDTLSKSIFAYNPHDVGVESIPSPPDTVFCDSTYERIAMARNYGEATETFDVVCGLAGSWDTVTVVDLGPGVAFPCSFGVWTVPPADSATYSMMVWTICAGDRNAANDLLIKSIFAYRWVGVEELMGHQLQVTSHQLHQNTPNPFTAATRVQFSVPSGYGDQHASLRIYDLSGRLIRTLFDETLTTDHLPLTTAVSWDGRDESGNLVAGGIYLYRLSVGDPVLSGAEVFNSTRKLVVVR